MRTRFRSSFLMFAVLAGFSLPGIALADSYIIDVLVFKYTGPDRSGGEQFLSPAGPGTMDTRDTGVEADKTSSRLDAMAALLAAQPDYQVILRKAWIQDSDLKYKVPLIRFGLDPDSVAAGVAGYMRFYRSRFLQLETELDFHPAGPAPVGDSAYSLADDNTRLTYRLTDKRRVKPRTVNYIDHPRFGVIVAVTPRAG